MRHAIVQQTHGGPEVLEWHEVEVPAPGPGEALVRHTAVGLNYIDVYLRSGLYPLLQPPGTIGMEAAGVVEAVGEGVDTVAPGDRVAYVFVTPGAYSEARVLPADRLVRIPDGVSDETAAAMMLKGMTAEYLLHRTTEVKAGDTVLVYAAAGGVGMLLTSWAKCLGCTVIGTVSTDAKAEAVRALGADHVIVTGGDDIAARVDDITGGKGCRYVYDGIGKDTFETSLEVLSKYGTFVSYGNASGMVPPVNLGLLSPKLLKICRPTLFGYIATREELESVAGNLFAALQSGAIKIDINQRFALKDAATAHRELEGRRTTGQSVLLPD